jgi:hypothetical protein
MKLLLLLFVSINVVFASQDWNAFKVDKLLQRLKILLPQLTGEIP